MSSGTGIQWTEATWNPIVGCSIVSPGCTNCYAMKMAQRLATHPKTPHYHGTVQTVKGKPVWTGHIAAAPDRVWEQPAKWRKPRRIFVNSMGDLFHEAVPGSWIDRAFAVMARCPQHQFQVLTKRADRMQEYADTAHRGGTHWLANIPSSPSAQWPLPNVWLGVSVEDQARADERIPHLLNTPAPVRWISAEPLLEPVDLEQWLDDKPPTEDQVYGPHGVHYLRHGAPWIDWAVIGGESGPGARLMDLAWARSIVKQCQAAGVPAFVKQLGARPVYRDPHGCQLGFPATKKGGDPAEWPADLRVREYPQ